MAARAKRFDAGEPRGGNLPDEFRRQLLELPAAPELYRALLEEDAKVGA